MLEHLFRSDNNTFLMFEKPPNQRSTLTEFLLNRQEPLDLEMIKDIAKSLLKTLCMLNSKEIVHLEICPDNIVLCDPLFQQDEKP
jgi:serine/threonine protein kinase